MADDGKVSKKDEIVGFSNEFFLVTLSPYSVELLSAEELLSMGLTEKGEEENHYIVKFPNNNFFIIVKGDNVYELWKERKLSRVNLSLEIATTAVESLITRNIECKEIPVV